MTFGHLLRQAQRRAFLASSRTILTRVVAAEPCSGQCSCYGRERILAEDGRPMPGAEFDVTSPRGHGAFRVSRFRMRRSCRRKF
jgi:hypothetical protein